MNILKQRQKILEDSTCPPPTCGFDNMPSLVSTKTTTSMHAVTTMLKTSKEMEKTPNIQSDNISRGSKPLSKGKCLIVQTHLIRAINRILEGYSETRDSSLMARFTINNAKAMNVEITNTKIAMGMGVIYEVEGKRKVWSYKACNECVCALSYHLKGGRGNRP